MAVATREITMSPRIGPAEEARQFLSALYGFGRRRIIFGKGEWLELRWFDCSPGGTKRPQRAFYRSIEQLIDRAMRVRDHADVFIGVGFRRCPDADNIAKCTHKLIGIDHVSRLPARWADLDVSAPGDSPKKSTYPSQLEILEALYALPEPPPIIVNSGAGIHCYWPYDEPRNDIEHVVDVNKRIRDRVRGDNAVDAARILRLPGTFNRKHGKPLPVTLLEGGQS